MGASPCSWLFRPLSLSLSLFCGGWAGYLHAVLDHSSSLSLSSLSPPSLSISPSLCVIRWFSHVCGMRQQGQRHWWSFLLFLMISVSSVHLVRAVCLSVLSVGSWIMVYDPRHETGSLYPVTPPYPHGLYLMGIVDVLCGLVVVIGLWGERDPFP